MAVFSIKDFSGTVPRIDPKYLQNNQAEVAENCDLYGKALRPLNHDRPRKDINRSTDRYIKNIYWYQNKNFFIFEDWNYYNELEPHDGDVDVVRAAIANNTYERTYWTGKSYDESRPAWIDNTCWANEGSKNEYDYPLYFWDLQVPRPTQQPIASYPGGGSPSDPDNVEDRTYVWTWVRRYNGIEEESAPSDPSSALSVTPGDTVELNLGNTPTLVQPLAQVRSPGTSPSCWTIYVYRTVSGVAGTEYQWVGEQANWSTDLTFSDSKLSEDLGDVIRTTDFGVPDDDLRGLTAMPNGIMAAFKKGTNEVHFCEPYQPHAWPVPYQLMTEYPIVAIASFGESLCVATTDAPYVITGIHPAAMSMAKLELSQSCESKRSMVDMGTFVVYASPDGLVAVGSGQADVITGNFFTKDDWQLLNPSSMHAVNWDNKYVCWYDATELGGEKGGFIFDPSDTNASLTWLTKWYECAYSDTETDRVYVVYNQGSTKWIAEWNEQLIVERDIDSEAYANHAPALVAANFDASTGVTFNGDGTLTFPVETNPTNELRWSDPGQEYDTSYRLEITIDSNTANDYTYFEFANTLMSPNTFGVAPGETGTIVLDSNYFFDFSNQWTGSGWEAENSWVIWMYSYGSGNITISDINFRKLWPGYYLEALRPDYRWRSKVFEAPKPINIAAGQIQGEQTFNNPITFRLFADGQQVFEKEIHDSRPFRMPTGYLAEEFQVEFQGTAAMTDFYMATSMRELAKT